MYIAITKSMFVGAAAVPCDPNIPINIPQYTKAKLHHDRVTPIEGEIE